MQKQYYLFLVLSLISIGTFAQELAVQEIDFSMHRGLMHDMMQSISGDLIVVGESGVKEKRGSIKDKDPRQALLLIINPDTEEVIDEKFGPIDRRNILYTLAQIEDGGFYVAGESSKPDNKQKKHSLLLRLDEKGKRLKEYEYAQEEGVYKHIAYLGNGNLVIAKELNKQNNNELELVFFKNGKRAFSKTYGDGNYDSLIGMQTTNDGSIILCGNTKKYGAVWLLKIGKDGNEIGNKVIRNEAGDIEVKAINAAYDGTLTLAGLIAKKNGQELWVAELNDQLNYWQKVIEDKKDESGLGIVKNVYNQYFLIDSYLNTSSKRARLLNNMEQTVTPMEFPRDMNLSVKKVLYSYQNNYIVGGNAGREDKFIRLLKIINKNTAAPKSIPFFSSTGLELIDFDINSGKEKILSPGERGSLSVTVKNNTDFAIRNATIKVSPLTESTGIRYFEIVREFYIGKKEHKKITIPFNAAEKLREGPYEFMLDFSDSDKEIGKIRLPPVQAKKSPTGNGGVIFIKFPEKESNDRTDGSSYELKTTIYSNRPLKQDDIKGYVNNIILEDSKGNKTFSTLEKREKDYSYEVIFNFQLKSNHENKLRIEIKDGEQIIKKEVFTVFQTDRKPNLHVLAIAPAYNNLDFNEKDANDFINVMEAQKNRGIFNEVLSYKYTGKDNTTTTALNIAFKLFCDNFTRAKGADKILKKDIVVIFYSGHGIIPNDRLKLVPSDYNPKALEITTIDYEEAILKQLDKMDCNKIVFIDACHSGASGSKSLGFDKGISEILNRLHNSPKGLITLASCDSNEQSFEDKNLNNSYFAFAIKEAFSGKSIELKDGTIIRCETNKDGFISIEQIYEFIEKRMKDLVPPDRIQHPQLIKGSGDLDSSIPLFKTIKN